MTKKEFLLAYQQKLYENYPKENPQMLQGFVLWAERTLGNNGRSTWNYTSNCAQAAWLALGNNGPPTLQDLRSLVD